MPTGIYERTEYHKEKISEGVKHKPEDVWKKVDIKSKSECWNWKGYTTPDGYGEMRINYLRYRTHRLVYELTYGSIPNNMLVCHKCDNPSCCNPDHLWLGTIQQNIKDMDNKGRRKISYGEKSPTHKLTSSQVKEIRRLYTTKNYTQRDLAKNFGVCQTTIWFILTNKNWKNI
ncbi:MAG: HNH endonuclease [Candidatus Methanoperedens sp.]